MRVDVTLEYRFHRTPDGAAWTVGAFPRSFWDRYLEVFDAVRVVARAHPVATPPAEAQRVDRGPVEFSPVPFYVGPAGFARQYRRIREQLREGVDVADAVIMRVPSPIGAALERELRGRSQPYGLEVVGDPYEALRRGSIAHPARAVARRWLTGSLRRMCAAAPAVAYVTATTLQERYPPGPAAHTTHYSSIDLPDDGVVAEPRAAGRVAQRLVTVAALDQRYKGVDVALDALALAVRGGTDLRLTVVGDGRLRGELEAQASSLGLGDRVDFTGQLPPDGVVAQLDGADLFVLASRTEGLPRALVEAMARGLPCLASAVGGVEELLDPADTVLPGSAAALAAALVEVAADPSRLGEMSARNLATARDYRESVLRPRRIEFYRQIRSVSEAWVAAGR